MLRKSIIYRLYDIVNHEMTHDSDNVLYINELFVDTIRTTTKIWSRLFLQALHTEETMMARTCFIVETLSIHWHGE